MNLTKEIDGLTFTPVTGGKNGYPQPEIGTFISGFANFETAKKYSKDFADGTLSLSHRRDGWDMVEVLSKNVYFPFEISDMKRPDDIMECDGVFDNGMRLVEDTHHYAIGVWVNEEDDE